MGELGNPEPVDDLLGGLQLLQKVRAIVFEVLHLEDV